MLYQINTYCVMGLTVIGVQKVIQNLVSFQDILWKYGKRVLDRD